MLSKKKFLVLVAVLSTLILGVQSVFAGGVDPDITYPVDSRICGRDGSSTQAVTVRWTNRFTTADPDSNTNTAYPPNTSVTIRGRDFWGCWVSVSSATEGDAWVPIDALNVNTVMGLPVLVDNSNGCSIADGAVTCGGGTGGNTGGGGCVIPASGPWPPCATGGNTGNTGCVIPASGPWPPCARAMAVFQ